MKKVLLCAVVVTCMVTIPLWWIIASADELAQGKELYSNKCQMCHGVGGKGDGPAAASFNPRPYNLATVEFWKNDAEKKIKDAIENGFGVMPPIGLNGDQTKAVVDYMAHTFKK